MYLSSKIFRADLFFILMSAALSGVVLYGTKTLPPAYFEPLGPAAFPKAIAIIVIALAITKLITLLVTSPKTVNGHSKVNWIRIIIPVIALLLISVYSILLSYRLLDFRITTALFLFIFVHLLKSDISARSSLLILIYSTSLSFAMYFTFTKIFYLNL